MISRNITLWAFMLLSLLCIPLSGIDAAAGEKHDFLFKNIGVEHGLSDRVVCCIEQDADGFLWFGTENGLNRYDGYQFDVFRHETTDSLTLSSSNISCLHADRKGRLWIGTSRGLNLYHPEDRSFSEVIADGDSDGVLEQSYIRCIYEDAAGVLWVGTARGLAVYDPDGSAFRNISFLGLDGTNNRNIIRSVEEDGMGNIWVGTFDGLFVIDRLTWEIEHLDVREIRPFVPDNNLTLSLLRDSRDSTVMWVGTETGLHRLDVCTRKFTSFSRENGSGLSNNVIKCMIPYEEDYLLIGTDGGLNLFSKEDGCSESFLHDAFDAMTLANNVVWDTLRDKDGNFWLATDNGICATISSPLNPKIYDADIPASTGAMPENAVSRLYPAPDGKIYLSLSDRVVVRSGDGPLKEIPFEKYTDIKVRTLWMDEYGTLWAGTTNSIWYKEADDDTFRHLRHPAIRYVSSISEDSDGNLWVESYNGICRISVLRNSSGHIADCQIRLFQVEDEGGKKYNSSSVFVDSRNRVWFMTSDNTLHIFDSAGGEISSFGTQGADGRREWSNVSAYLETDAVYILTDTGIFRHDENTGTFVRCPMAPGGYPSLHSMVADKFGNIWAATNSKLLRLDMKSGTRVFFDISNFLDKGIVRKSLSVAADGRIWVGGYNRYLSFLPEEDYDSEISSVPVISDAGVFGTQRFWDRGKGDIPELELSYRDNSIDLSYSLLDFQSPESVQYSYILEGADKSWKTVTGKNKALYSNLPPGRYTFKVKASRSDERWTGPAVLKIRIKPPFWLAWYAYLFYFLILAGIAYYIWRTAKLKLILAEKVRIESVRREAQQELIQYKIRFFTNISHEFRTPLTLILGPLDEMLDKMSSSTYGEQLRIMKSNAERLLRLVNQIMDFSKIEKGSITLHPQDGELVDFLKRIHSMFLSEAASRQISYSFVSEWPSYYTSFDDDKLEKIVYNLLSNAFKYTPDCGSVRLFVGACLMEGKPGVELKVEDTGVGIPEGDETAIFERFYQSSYTDGARGGTGIGLSLVKDYVALFGGTIGACGNPGPGSTFRVCLPFPAKDFSELESMEELRSDESMEAHPRNTVLVVDDNLEMCTFMQVSLEQDYKVVVAHDGAEGLAKVHRYNPDIIVSDVMMPVMDGLEFCRRIKEEETTSHIPFVLLTAKNGDDNVYAGLKTGADDYISKPFSMKLLKLRLEKIISTREAMQLYIQRRLQFGDPRDGSDDFVNTDDPFVDKVVSAIHEQLSNEKLDVALLSEILKMPKQQLYRKVKALTGFTVVELVRSVRLKVASAHLAESSDTVSEIMYSVGFTNNSYFSKCFSEQYGCSPSEYRKRYRKS